MNIRAEHVSLLARRLTVESEEFSRLFAHTHSLNSTDMRAFVLIMDAERHGHPMSASQLSDQLGIKNASVTALLDRLEKADHIERHPHPTDRRKLVIKVSDHAMQLGREYFMALHTATLQKLSTFSDAELAVSERVIQAMIDAMDEQKRSIVTES